MFARTLIALFALLTFACGAAPDDGLDRGVYVQPNDLFTADDVMAAGSYLEPLGITLHKAPKAEAKIWIQVDEGACPFDMEHELGYWAAADHFGVGITIWTQCYGIGPEFVNQSDDRLGIINTLVHEILHKFGVQHVEEECPAEGAVTLHEDVNGDPICGPAIMNPGYTKHFTALQPADFAAFDARRE